MRNILAILLGSCCVLLAQQEVKLSQQPENVAYSEILHYTGTVLDYICTAQALQNPSQITVTTISNASPAAVTATAHGIYYSAAGVVAKPVIFISGATGGWTGLNGTWVATPTSANAFTIPVDTSAFGTFSGQSIVVTTRAPLTTKAIWTVQAFVSDASNNPVFIAYKSDSTTTTLGTLGGGSTRPNALCAAPGSYQ